MDDILDKELLDNLIALWERDREARIPPLPAYIRPGQRTQTRLPQVVFATSGVPPPSPLYLDADTWVHLSALATVANTQVFFNFTTQSPGGEVKHHSHTLILTTAGTRVTRVVNLGEGFILAAVVGENTSLNKFGQCFAAVLIVNGGPTVFTFQQRILQGPVTNTLLLSWPGQPFIYPNEIDAAYLDKAVTTPAAGAEWTVTIPTGAIWRLHAITWTFTTSAVVAQRRCMVQANTPTGDLYVICVAGSNQAASTTLTYTAGAALVERSTIVDQVVFPLLYPIVFPSGTVFQSKTENRQAGDQYDFISMVVNERADF